MARSRLSTGIFSPLHSDISMNEASISSFGSLLSTPEFEKETESPQNKQIREELKFSTLRNSSLTEDAVEFELVIKDFKRDKNAKKEEKFKNTYEQLKHSFDELFPKKVPGLSILSPISKIEDFESTSGTKSFDKRKENVQHSQDKEAYLVAEPQFWHHTASSKVEENSFENNSKCKKEKYCQFKSISEFTESHISLDNEHESKKKEESPKSHRAKSSKMRTTSTQTCDSIFQAYSAIGNKRQNTISTSKTNSSSGVQHTENKEMSIEKSIQIAISMELDKIRSLMLDQKLSLGKEMLKLQEMNRQQSEVVNSLLNVIEELLEENKKLRATDK